MTAPNRPARFVPSDEQERRAALWQARFLLEVVQDNQGIPRCDYWRPTDEELDRLLDHALFLRWRRPDAGPRRRTQ